MAKKTAGDGRRQRRVGESIRTELSNLFTREMFDREMQWVTVTGVDVSPDLKHARVFYVATGDSTRQTLERKLEKVNSFLRKKIADNLNLRFTPNMQFKYDETFDEGSRIDSLIDETQQEMGLRHQAISAEQRLSELLSGATKILLCVHANPDGDAIGGLLGLYSILQLMGKSPVCYCPDGIPKTLAFLPGVDDVVSEIDTHDQFELTILMDTGSEKLLPQGFPSKESRGILAVIDHHMTFDIDIEDITIRRPVSSVGELLFDLAQELVWPLDENVAHCLYTSIVADTGSFRYTSTKPETHRVAARLIELGAKPWTSATALFESFPLSRQKILGQVLNTLAISSCGKMATLKCTPEMLSACGATTADLDGMVNFGRQVDGVEVAVMFRQEPSGRIKVSFRSKGSVDVAQLATTFGGGGHKNAAGASVENVPLDDVINQVVSAANLLLCGDIKE